jgi:hypothetical protein
MFKITALQVASYLTEPVCKVRECFYRFYTLSETCKTTAQKVAQVAVLTITLLASGLIAPITAPFGMAMRWGVSQCESEPYTFMTHPTPAKVLPADRKITIVSHNECLMPGGYAITDGQVTPPSDRTRLDANLQEIKRLNPDVVCLYEVPDICDATYIASQLPEYPFIIPSAGVRTVGPSSMLFVASKYEIDALAFTPFVKKTEISGRAQNAEMGFLSFDLKSQNQTIAHVVTTHLQPSEVPAQPEDHEAVSRASQMRKIAHHIQQKLNTNILFTGDLNQTEEELNSHRFNWLRRDPEVLGKSTWGGDAWCARLMNKPASPPLTLDYTFVAGKAVDIQTQILDNNYNAEQFRPEALSDHHLLFSRITLGGE